MNALTLNATALTVDSINHLNLQNLLDVDTMQLFLESLKINGVAAVIKVLKLDSPANSLYVSFSKDNRHPLVHLIQTELNRLGVAYSTSGNFAPHYNWGGYVDLSYQKRLAVEQRTDMIKKGYDGLKSHVRAANTTAWSTGKMLYEQRADLSHNKHGGFQGWYKAEMPNDSKDTIYRLIRIYETYPEQIPQTVELSANLSVLYEITEKGTPDMARAEIEDRLAQGETINGTQAKAIVAEHKDIQSMMWLDPNVINAFVYGYVHSDGSPYVSFEHLQALTPLQNLLLPDDVRLNKKATFDKVTDIPTPQALYKRLSLGELTVDETRMVVNRMVAMARPSANDLSMAEFSEAEFDSLNKADASDKSEYDQGEAPTGVEWYVFINGGTEVLNKRTGEILTFAQFEKQKREKAKAAKPKRKSGGGGGGGSGGKQSASAAHGDAMARGMVAQMERAQARTQAEFLSDELKKLDESVLDLLAVKISDCRKDNADLRNPISYLLKFIQA